MIIAAPTPEKKRDASIIPVELACAAAAFATPNTVSPASSLGLRPLRSASGSSGRRSAAKLRV
jgi:hypothetical protein